MKWSISIPIHTVLRAPIPQQEVHNVEGGEVLQLDGQVEGSESSGVPRERGPQVHSLRVHLSGERERERELHVTSS